jgi:cob(I)alamin adenosyltransferase
MKIYTRTGDKGDTGLYGGERRPKHDIRITAYGEVDELQAQLGLAVAELPAGNALAALLEEIQMDCFVISAELARTETKPERKDPVLAKERTAWLEQQIDELDRTLQPLRAFIVPGGGRVGASLHVTRAVARRAERAVVLVAAQEEVSPAVLTYLNRLSDFLFTAARYQNQADGHTEKEWRTK